MESIKRLALKDPKGAAALERALEALADRALALYELSGSAALKLSYRVHRGRLAEIGWNPHERFRP